MKFNVRTRLIFFAAILVSIVGGGVTLYALIGTRSRLVAGFESQSLNNALVIAASLTDQLYSLNTAAIRGQLKRSRDLYPAIAFSYVTDPHGIILTDGTSENPNRDQMLEDPQAALFFKVSKTIAATSWEKEDMIEVGAPVRIPDGTVIGYLFLGYSMSEVFQTIHESAKATLSITILALLIGIIIAAFFARSFTRPIKELAVAAEAIRRGDLSRRAPVLSEDELGELARTFNQMMENLSSEKKYRAMTNAAPNAIISINNEGRIISWNPTAEKVFGYKESEILGQPVTTIVPERFREAHGKGLKRYLETGKTTVIGRSVELAGLKKTGEEFPLELNLSVWDQESEIFFTGIIRDLSERKAAEREKNQLEDQLRSAQKMEAVGRLTGGVAHDFNNLLGIIIGYCELSLMDAVESPLKQNLREIKEAGERATALTRHLLAFSRKQVLQPQVLNLNDVLGRMDRMLRRVIGEDINLLTYLDPNLESVKADPNQMEQVVLNLALNARDAMPQGGNLTLETKNVALDEEYAKHHIEVHPGPYVMMAVSDTGTGMTAETMHHALEPFFTTKERGKGTGLGLSTVYGIVKQSGGHISIYSEPGHGASFKIYLQRVEGKAESLLKEKTVEASLGGYETVLVAEDEEKLRALICLVLKGKGYTILEASSGQEALQISKSHPEPIAILVTDVIMPGMSGREVAKQLTSQRPDLKVLFISGYAENAIVHHGVLDKDLHFLQKPFTPEALAKKVREVITS